MKAHLVWFGAGCFLLGGCSTPQNYQTTDFSGDKIYNHGASPGPQLSENEVLGLKTSATVSDEDIRRILDETRSLSIKSGSRVLVVQSGAVHPDHAMVQELSRHFVVVSHSGMPDDLTRDGGSESTALRLAAAHSSAESILVYWGNLEMKRNDLLTSLVSWVPVVDFTVPDEHQKVRMFLKLALIDVRTGNWATFRTEAIEEEALTTRHARKQEKTWSLERSKQRLYEAAVKKLADGYVVAM